MPTYTVQKVTFNKSGFTKIFKTFSLINNVLFTFATIIALIALESFAKGNKYSIIICAIFVFFMYRQKVKSDWLTRIGKITNTSVTLNRLADNFNNSYVLVDSEFPTNLNDRDVKKSLIREIFKTAGIPNKAFGFTKIEDNVYTVTSYSRSKGLYSCVNNTITQTAIMHKIKVDKNPNNIDLEFLLFAMILKSLSFEYCADEDGSIENIIQSI